MELQALIRYASRILLAFAVLTSGIAFAAPPVPLNSPATAVPGTITTYGTQPNQAVSGNPGIGTSGANVCVANGTCTRSGTTNFTGPIQVNGTAQSFPASGILLGTTDAQSPTNKTINADANTLQNLRTGNFATGIIDPDPTLSANSNSVIATQAATKAYADNAANGLVYKTPVQLATTGSNISLSGEQTIDGTLTSSSPVLVKDETDATTNGIYTSGSGAWVRRSDANTGALLKNAAVLVTAGSANANSTWTCPCAAVTIGITAINFVKISGSNTYTGSNGVQLIGNQFSTDSTVTRNTAAQTLTGKNMDGGSNTFTNIPNGGLVHSAVTVGGQAIALGGTTANQGGGGKLQLSTGSTTTNDCVKYDSSGNTVDAGAACGTSILALAGASGQLQSNNGAGNLAAVAIGTGSGTVAAGNDSRIVGAAQQAGNNTMSGTNAFTGAFTQTQGQDIPWQRYNPVVTPPAEFSAPPGTSLCGSAISSEANGLNPLIVALPVAPPPGCVVFLYASGSVNPIWIDPNPGGGTGGNSGAYIKTNDFDRVATLFTLPGSEGHAGFFLRYVSNGIGWQFNDGVAPPSSLYRYNLHHGAVRFDHDPSLAQTRLCPHGDGGLIILRKLTYIAPTCIPMPDATVGANSTFYYVYALRQVQVPVVATEPGGSGSHCPTITTGAICMTLLNFGDATYFQNGGAITAVNFGLNPLGATLPVGTTGANVYDDPNTVVFKTIGTPNVTYIGLSDVSYVAPEAAASYAGGTTPQLAFTVLKPDSAPILDPLTEVMVNQSRSFETLVGAVYVDAGGNVVSSPCEQNVTSYYNRLPAQFKCVLATSTSTSASTYRTPAASFQGQFISFGSPNSGGNPAVPFTGAARVVAPGTSAPFGGLAVIFDHISRAGNSVCATGATPEAPDNQTGVSMAQSVNHDLAVSGITTAPQEGFENYMHACFFSSTLPGGGGSSGGTVNILGTTDTGLPGGTIMTALLWQ